MTRFRVEFSKAAEAQADAIDSWWVEHRPAAPDLFWSELRGIVQLLEISPLIGKLYQNADVPGVRRILIGRSRYHVYWEVDLRARAVTVTAVWHGERGSGPPL